MAIRAKKVLVLVHPKFRPDRADVRAVTERDVWRSLLKLGLTVEIAGADEDLRAFDRMLAKFQPSVVFNLLEEFRGEAVFDFHLVAYLEALGIPCTGCNPRGLIQSRNKWMTAQIAAGLGVLVPRGNMGTRGKLGRGLKFPLFVKLNREHASLGIRESSLVEKEDALLTEIERLRETYAAEILVQEFVAGHDVSIAVWGNSRVEVFDPRRLDMKSVDRVATERLKFSASMQKRKNVRSRIYEGPQAARLRREAAQVYAALDLSGYARLDYRVPPTGAPYLIDVNANPNLARGEDFALSAMAKGIEYPQVLESIMALAYRYHPRV